MTVNDWIIGILMEEKRPMSSNEIANRLSELKNSSQSDVFVYSGPEVLSHVQNFPSIFQLLGSWIILTADTKWQEFLSNYSYIGALLRPTLSTEDQQFAVAAFVVYKRLIDCRDAGAYSVSPSDDLLHLPSRKSSAKILDVIKSLNAIDRENGFTVRVFSELSRQILRIPLSVLDEILSALQKFETAIFSNHEFAIIFSCALDVNDTTSGRKPALIRTPPNVVELMVALLEARNGTVVDPVCGTGGLLSGVLRSADNVSVKGYEISDRAARFAFMILLLQTGHPPEVIVENCFSDFRSSTNYDFIIGDLPLSPFSDSDDFAAITEKYSLKFAKKSRGFAPTLLYVFEKLSRRGRAVLTVSDGFLASRGTDESVRKLLIAEDIVEAVISLPSNSLRPYANGKASILVLNKSKPSYLLGRIKFIDATEATSRARFSNFNIQEIVTSYKSKELDGRRHQLVTTESVESANTLQVAFYTEKYHQIHEMFSDRGAVPLGELVTIKRGADLVEREHSNTSTGIPFVRIENLERDVLDLSLSAEGFKNFIDNPSQYQKSIISSEVLLVARIGDNLKPTYFRPSKNLPRIIAHSNVLILSPVSGTHEAQINFEYLYYQFYSSFVQKQVERKRQGAVMPFISIKSLKSLLIPLMETRAQIEFVATQKANIIAAERERVNQRLKLIGFEERDIQKESDIVSTLVHELRPKLVGIFTFAKKVARIVERCELSNFKEYDDSAPEPFDANLEGFLLTRENMSLHELGERLIKDAEGLNDTLSVVQNVMNFALKPNEFDRVDLHKFILDYFSTRAAGIGEQYSYEVRGASAFVDINPQAFQQMLDQLMANALRHAFKIPSLTNRISFVTREDRDRGVAVLDYSNNGAPFVLSQQDFVGFFNKSKDSVGSGIGGNLVYRIVKAHGGDLRIREDMKKGFFMRVELPLRKGEYDK